MSGPPRVKSMNFEELDNRLVLGPGGNTAKSMEMKKPVLKLKSEIVQLHLGIDEVNGKKSPDALSTMNMGAEKISTQVASKKNAGNSVSSPRQRKLSLSLNASCSSDASSDSSQSRPSTGRISRRSSTPTTPPLRKKNLYNSKVVTFERNGKGIWGENDGEVLNVAMAKKRCAWVTSNADPLYVTFHDEEWGLPVHDDNKLFELLSFSTALAELTWPAILSKRHIFRDVFLEFDPIAVSKLNEKKITSSGSPASSLLSELKLRGIIENARQICKIIEEFGSFDKYIWSFVNYKPTVGNFRYPRQVPIKTSKADFISKDLVRRGFRGVGATVTYSFMQVAGITNDHLITCFRYQDCMMPCELIDKNYPNMPKTEEKPEDMGKFELAKDIDDLNLSR